MVVKRLENRELQDNLQAFIDDAATMGYSFIELIDKKRSMFGRSAIGVEQLIISEQRLPGQRTVVGFNDQIISDGELRFMPDGKGRCYGYLLDTPANRDFLIEQLEYPICTILDLQISNDIKKLAIKRGNVAEEALIQDPTLNLNEEAAEIDRLRRELAEIKHEKEKIEEEKPLRSVSRARTGMKKAESRRKNAAKKESETTDK